MAQPDWHVIVVQGDPTVIEHDDDGAKKYMIAMRPFGSITVAMGV